MSRPTISDLSPLRFSESLHRRTPARHRRDGLGKGVAGAGAAGFGASPPDQGEAVGVTGGRRAPAGARHGRRAGAAAAARNGPGATAGRCGPAPPRRRWPARSTSCRGDPAPPARTPPPTRSATRGPGCTGRPLRQPDHPGHRAAAGRPAPRPWPPGTGARSPTAGAHRPSARLPTIRTSSIVGPVLAHFRALHPRQREHRGLDPSSSTAKKPRRACGSTVARRRASSTRCRSPCTRRVRSGHCTAHPAVDHGHHRQRDQRHRERPRQQSQHRLQAAGPSRRSPGGSARGCASTAPRSRCPTAARSLGTSEWLVMPRRGVDLQQGQLAAGAVAHHVRPGPSRCSRRRGTWPGRGRGSRPSAPSRPGHRYWVSSAMYFARSRPTRPSGRCGSTAARHRRGCRR